MNYFRTMEWFEELPEGCPPDDAYLPNNEQFFRLVEQYPPTETDFLSQRRLYPQKSFHTNECRARSLSMFSVLFECVNILKLPAHRNKRIIQLKLPNKSGVILQTGRAKTHYSWWRSKYYNPIPYCKEIELNLI